MKITLTQDFLPWEQSQAFAKLCVSTIFFNILKTGSLILFSLPISPEKKLVKAKVCENEERIWAQYCLDHPSFQLPKICLDNVNSHRLWSLAKDYPDLVSRLHTQTRLMCNFGLNAGVPWLTSADSCFICKNETENVDDFFFACPDFRVNFKNFNTQCC